MSSPSRNKVAMRYLESLGDTPSRLPLQSTLKYNLPARNNKDEDLDVLAKQLNITPSSASPSKTALLRTRFESPSVTVSSFKTPLNKSSASSSRSGSPIKRSNFDRDNSFEANQRKNGIENKPVLNNNDDDLEPSWAKRNYRENLNRSPSKGSPNTDIHTPSRVSAKESLRLNRPGSSSVKLSPLKQLIEPATPKSRPFLQSPSNSTSRDSPGYEYLCRIQAIREWLEHVLEEEISQSPAELISYIRNGILLAKLANVILPTRRSVFTNDSKLQFRHTENINRFFSLLDYMNVPDLFRFELTDLYDAKNVPKVWFCLHAITYMLNKSGDGYPKLRNLVAEIDFTDADIRIANRALVGSGLPNFSSADSGNSVNSDNAYMEKMVKESPKKAFPKQTEMVSRLVEIHTSPPQDTRKIFVESAIQTDEINPFRVSLNANSPRTHVGTSTVSSRLDEGLSLSTPRYTFDEVEFASKKTATSTTRNYDTSDIELHTAHIIKLQSLARGANFRYKMFVKKIMLKSFSDELSYFTCLVKGNMARKKTIHKHRDELKWYEDDVVRLQSVIRSSLAKSHKRVHFEDSESEIIVKVQSLIRGGFIRAQASQTMSTLFGQAPQLTQLQSIVRRNRIYKYSLILIPCIGELLPSTIEFQSICRGYLSKNQRNIGALSDFAFTKLQSTIRGHQTRESIFRKRAILMRNQPELKELQSIARAGISRSRLCNNVLLTLLYEDQILNGLYAKVRANNVRREFQHKKRALEHYKERSIIPIQSTFRGILVRFQREIKLDDMYQEVDNLIQFQSIIRGNRTRYKYKEMMIYYQYNVDQVIRAQAILRSKFTRQAYKSLINLKNPSLATISQFAYLLTDNDKDYQEEMELSDLKDKIIESSKLNEDLENQIENLDIKLSLLDKNKISIEEFIKNKKKPSHTKTNELGTKHLERLNKTSRARIELYQLMFYFLQTKPAYFVRYYRNLAINRHREDPEEVDKMLKLLQSFILLVFPVTSNSPREEYFFVKFILEMMENDIEQNCALVSDLTKAQSSFWIEYFLSFNNHTSQRQHLKSMVSSVVNHVIENDELNFEADPCQIYAELAAKELKVTGYTDKGSKNISPQLAIKNPDVSAQFIENLMNLREVSTDLLNLLDTSISKIPKHVRVICNHSYKLSKLNFPNKTHQQHLAVAGVIFIKHYISLILHCPENFGYLVKDPFNPSIVNSLKCEQNLKSLGRVLLQLFSLRPFNDNFLKPLNDYLVSSSEMTTLIITRLIDVNGIDKEYEMNDYNDIIEHNRPKLSMSVSKMIEIEKFVTENVDIMAPSADDQLFMVASKLSEVLNSIEDYMTLTEFGNLTLNLNPTTKEDSLADSKVRSLVTQVKRCVLYIIRIQEGDNLLELLISGILSEHEEKFKAIVSHEQNEIQQSRSNEKKNPYYRTSLGDLSLITYHELKKMALNFIIQLETLGHVTRKNSYQEILNQIAIDIKTKGTQRIGRNSQLEISLKTIAKLNDKEKFLKKQLSDYNNHIEKILSQLQLKPKDRKIFNIIPVFSKQYFYHRELRKRNRLPKFGSYKYSSKKLMDQKILLDFGGMSFGSSTKLDFMFSCHSVGKFVIEAANGSVNVPGAFDEITLDQLLNYQYENSQKIKMFDNMMVFDCENLIGFIFRKFYDIH